MSALISPTITAQPRSMGKQLSVRSLDLEGVGGGTSPLLVCDDFRVSGHPFGPHPHAGISAVTYVFEDSSGGLRSRDSLGNDHIVGPGGMVWSQAGRGMQHDELPAQLGSELHGLQFFVKLSTKNELVPAKVFRLLPEEVPEWRGATGDRVRVVVGTHAGLTSPLAPAEPFTLLDVELQREVSVALVSGQNAVVYITGGQVTVLADGNDERSVSAGQALAIHGARQVSIRATQAARAIVLGGTDLREPLVIDGPFMMSDRAQIEAAKMRYRNGEMGHLAPLEG